MINMITKFLTGVAFILTCSMTLSSQGKFNQYNPYVNNSEIHHLRNMGIDLFNKPYVDDDFKNNVRLSLALSKEYKSENAKYALLGVSSIMGILVGVAGVFIHEENNKFILSDSGQTIGTTSIKSQYILLGAAGTLTAGFALKARNQRNASKSRFEQQIEITKGQYKLLR